MFHGRLQALMIVYSSRNGADSGVQLHIRAQLPLPLTSCGTRQPNSNQQKLGDWVT
jgi:hypothetical protein